LGIGAYSGFGVLSFGIFGLSGLRYTPESPDALIDKEGIIE
jgi:hypothetical protein